ncbi:MAG: Ppx/GppA family phosphatase [Alphaproteobacteria bacterium]|nr:Ppx/GppA family phosphatase [Alphaproteobacteria bacterium]
MPKPQAGEKRKYRTPDQLDRKNERQGSGYYAAIDLGTNSCRLVIAQPTPSSFHVVETFSKITRLGEDIIHGNMLTKPAVKRTLAALRVCRAIIDEYSPIIRMRFVATAACRRALNGKEFEEAVERETGLDMEVISSKEEARLAVVGCMPLLNRMLKRALVFDIGGGSTEISLARVTETGKTFIEGFVSLPYGVVTISEAFPGKEMTNLAYNTIVDRTQKILQEFEEKYHIAEAIKNQEIQVIGTSGTVTVLGAVHLNLPRYNRAAVDGIALSGADVEKVINRIKNMGYEGRCRHSCIGKQKADLTISGCAIIEALYSFWSISEITIADRGIREGILLDMIHHQKNNYFRQDGRFRKRFKKGRQYAGKKFGSH